MTTTEIIHEILDYLRKDRNYDLVPGKDENTGQFMLQWFATFRIVNEVPENHFAPYFQVASIEQAKEIVTAICVGHQPGTDLDKLEKAIDKEIAAQPVNTGLLMYLTMYVTTNRALSATA